jgi:transposase InsO family protein
VEQRKPGPGLVQRSDRGSQYASNDYTDLLKERGIKISMSRKGNPWDNAFCESFMKTLKYEGVLRNEYRDMPEAKRSIARFLEQNSSRSSHVTSNSRSVTSRHTCQPNTPFNSPQNPWPPACSAPFGYRA